MLAFMAISSRPPSVTVDSSWSFRFLSAKRNTHLVVLRTTCSAHGYPLTVIKSRRMAQLVRGYFLWAPQHWYRHMHTLRPRDLGRIQLTLRGTISHRAPRLAHLSASWSGKKKLYTFSVLLWRDARANWSTDHCYSARAIIEHTPPPRREPASLLLLLLGGGSQSCTRICA